MSSLFQSFRSNQALPVSHSSDEVQGLRRRLSSLSVRIQPAMSASSMGFRRSISASYNTMNEQLTAGGSIKKWWECGLAWILSRKPTFAVDLEMNEEETAVLGCQSKGSWRHVFYKVRSEIRRFLGSDQVGRLPQTFTNDPQKRRTHIHG